MAEVGQPPAFRVDQLPDGDGLRTCSRGEIARWLLDSGLARPNGSPDTFELTERGLEAAREVDQLGFWIRS